jgi:hypothetical protein
MPLQLQRLSAAPTCACTTAWQAALSSCQQPVNLLHRHSFASLMRPCPPAAMGLLARNTNTTTLNGRSLTPCRAVSCCLVSLLWHQQAHSSSLIQCHVQQGSQSISLPCDVDSQLSDGMQQHNTGWRDTAAQAGLSQPGVAAATIGVLVEDGGSAGGWYSGYGRRRQQHRKLVRLS